MHDRAPWRFDERDFLIARRFDEGGLVPIIQRIKRRDFKKHNIPSRHLWYTNRSGYDWRCFYTGIQCYHVHAKIMDRTDSVWFAPWALTFDHLVPVRHLAEFDVSIPPNGFVVVTGLRFNNSTIGHHPMPVKLMARKHLLGVAFDRENPSPDDATKAYIEFRRVLMPYHYSGGGYWWQPRRDAPDDVHARAASLLGEMKAVEREFCRIPLNQKKAWIDAFEWKW